MKIGFLISTVYAVGNPGNGVLAQARSQAKALRDLGCEVVELNPWEPQSLNDYDVIQFFQGGFNFHMVEECKRRLQKGILVFAPIIDTNQANVPYRIAAMIGRLFSKIYTFPSVFQLQANKSDVVICRSHHEKERLLYGLGVNENKVEIVLNGTDIPQTTDLDAATLRRKFDFPEEFILHVSGFTSPRKNVVKLIQAVMDLNYPMVIAGYSMPGEVLDEIKNLISGNDKITLMGFVDKEKLDALYSCCKVFCLPSIHEGTGLVALEAGVRGANVVITQNGGPPDYFGEHAEYVNPDDVTSIKNAIKTSWKKAKPISLIQHINEKLTWEVSAKNLLLVYQKHIAKKMAEQKHEKTTNC